MKIINKILFQLIIVFFACNHFAFAQKNKSADSIPGYKIISAGPEYERSSFHQWLWGSNYRKEWSTPVKVSVMLLDTAKGGLIPYKAGGNQTKSLHLRSENGEEYALRSVNKKLSKILPEIFQNTFIEDIVNDEVSMSHPYAASSIPLMAQKANIFHTNPQYVFLPDQPVLDTFKEKFTNNLYLFEQRPDGNWKEGNNSGNFKEFLSTEEVLEKMLDDNGKQVDQHSFVRARLFDMFIGDWDRRENQWQWAVTETNNKTIYKPVPQDRDQAYFKYNGVLLKLLIPAAGLNYMQSFADNIPDVTTFNYQERNLDRFFTNQLTLNDWQNIAGNLQQLLTDDVIEKALKQLPPEIFKISGDKIISTLKARRGHLAEWATTYYLFLEKEVEITGSKEREHFEIKQMDDTQTLVKVYKVDKEEKQSDSSFYSRVFKTNETKEIRLYGLSGKDTYTIEGNINNGIKVRIIGGVDKDSIVDPSVIRANTRSVHIYDNHDNFFKINSREKLHLSNDTSVNAFKYNAYLYNKKGIVPSIFYSNEDRIYVGLGYQLINYKWRKEPFASKQLFDVHYSFAQKGFSVTYKALFPELINEWDLALKAKYDAIRWTQFFGLGNETSFTIKDIDYYRMRTEEWIINPGIIHRIGRSTVDIGGLFQSFRIINDSDRFIAKFHTPSDTPVFNSNSFAGAQAGYLFQQLNDSVVPTKGIIFSASATGLRDLKKNSKSFFKYAANLQLNVPLISKFSFVLRTGASTVTGTPQFYQYASIGDLTLRGFRRDRFWGKTAFYNMNDLRFISNIKTHFFNGKGGLFVFFDNGRVWMPAENSKTLHTGYGAGIILAPFNKILTNITYGISDEEKLIQFRISKYF